MSPSKGQTQQVSNVHVSLRAPIHVDCVTRGNSLQMKGGIVVPLKE